jgi:hypothetical protein
MGERPLLALGVLPSSTSARHLHDAAARRDAIRTTWLAAPLPSVITRFVLLESDDSDQHAGPHGVRRKARGRKLAETHADVLRLPANTSACGCAELVHAWFSTALARWPNSRFYGKTDDDIYVRLPLLSWELRRLTSGSATVRMGGEPWLYDQRASSPQYPDPEPAVCGPGCYEFAYAGGTDCSRGRATATPATRTSAAGAATSTTT